jgi:hypothetical protein
MIKIVLLFIIICSFTSGAFSQKVEFKEGIVLVDKVEVLNYELKNI